MFLIHTLIVAGLVAGTTPAAVAPVATAEKNIVETAVDAGSFNTLAAALKAAGLVDALSGRGPFTVFAPTDDAFAKLPRGTVETLLKPENKDKLTAILTYHVVSGDMPAKRVLGAKTLTTLNGQRIDISQDERAGKAFVDGAVITATDIRASNGVIHVIDSVILPADKNLAETAIAAGDFGTLVAAAQAAGLVPALTGKDDLTVFAPTDDAFAKLPAGTVETLLKPENVEQLKAILLYHVVSGRVYSDQAAGLTSAPTLEGSSARIAKTDAGLTIDGATIVAADIEATNGVIHVIDSVILPPKREAAADGASRGAANGR